MKRIVCVALIFPMVMGAFRLSNGQTEVARSRKDGVSQKLALTDTVVVKSELAEGFVDPLKCDGSGNFYLMTSVDANSGIRKLNAKGDRLAVFVANSASDVDVLVATFFSVTPDGDVYQLAFLRKSKDRVVLVFNKDGTYKTHIKLDTDFTWIPSEVAAFPSGDFLVTGLRNNPDRDVNVKLPFTAIFSSSGNMKKQISLQDDKLIEDLASSGDSHVVPPTHPLGNVAVEGGQMEAGEDGNIYLMRRMSPAIFYAISPGGEVVKRFFVDAGSADLSPIAMHLSGTRIAILFRNPQTREQIIKVVDLSGKKVATYDDQHINGKGMLGSAFACYATNPAERFFFLFTADDGYLGFRIAEPR